MEEESNFGPAPNSEISKEVILPEMIKDKKGEVSLEQRKEKIVCWCKNPYNLTFAAIFILAAIIRISFFILTKNQPLWTDESDYMAYAKTLAGIGNTTWIVNAAHSSLFPFLAAAFFKIGFSEVVIKFFLEFIPSLLLVALTYYLVVIVYSDKKIALISAFLMATFWNILFNSFRFHVGIPAMFFGFLAIFVFFQGYEKKQKIFGKINPSWAIPLTVLFVFLCYSIRRGYFLFGVFFFVYLLFTQSIKDLIRDKYNWIGLVVAVVAIFLTDKFIFVGSIVGAADNYIHLENTINFVSLGVFKIYFSNEGFASFSPLLYLFYIGFALMIVNIFLFMDKIRKPNNLKLKGDLFFILTIVLTFFYFIFYLRADTVGDPRWYLPVLSGCFICISRATVFCSDYIKRYNKILAILFIVLLLGYGGYYQYQHGKQIIEAKVGSFEGIKQASLYLKEISNQKDKLYVVTYTQSAYYAEREVIFPALLANTIRNQEVSFEMFLEGINGDENIRYLIVTFSEPNHPDWMRQEEYVQDPKTGQVSYSKWKIPFMDTEIDFQTGKQDIKQSKAYGNITFNLIGVYEDAFVYEIRRN